MTTASLPYPTTEAALGPTAAAIANAIIAATGRRWRGKVPLPWQPLEFHNFCVRVQETISIKTAIKKQSHLVKEMARRIMRVFG